MRRRDFLKVGLITAAIPVGANMVWKRTSMCREMEIRWYIRNMLLCKIEQFPQIKEAIPYLDETLNLTLSGKSTDLGALSESEIEVESQYFFDLLSSINLHLMSKGSYAVRNSEMAKLAEVFMRVEDRFRGSVSRKALNVLCGTVAMVAKLYQIRPDLEL